MRDLVGDEEAQALEQIQQMMRELEEEGLVKRNGDRYELTSTGIRRIGQKALEDIFASSKGRLRRTTGCRSAAMAASATTRPSPTTSATRSTCIWARR